VCTPRTKSSYVDISGLDLKMQGWIVEGYQVSLLRSEGGDGKRVKQRNAMNGGRGRSTGRVNPRRESDFGLSVAGSKRRAKRMSRAMSVDPRGGRSRMMSRAASVNPSTAGAGLARGGHGLPPSSALLQVDNMHPATNADVDAGGSSESGAGAQSQDAFGITGSDQSTNPPDLPTPAQVGGGRSVWGRANSVALQPQGRHAGLLSQSTGGSASVQGGSSKSKGSGPSSGENVAAQSSAMPGQGTNG